MPDQLGMLDSNAVNLSILKERAYNHRWAEVPDGVIPLTAADPDLPCAPAISEAIIRYSKDRYFSYGPTEGLPKFKEAVAKSYLSKRNVNVAPANVMAVDTAAYGIYLTCKTLLTKGNEVIIFNPVDFLFRYGIEAAGAKAIPYAIPQSPGHVDKDKIEGLITPRCKLLCLCNPLNPTGKVFSPEELQIFVDLAEKHDLYILSDEIWSDIVFQPNVYTSIASLSEQVFNRTIIVNGFSKSYGLAGLRIGSLIAPTQALFERLLQTSRHDSTVHGANTLGQVAAIAALEDSQEWLQAFVMHLHEMRTLTVNRLNALPGITCQAPEGCYLTFPDVSGTGLSSVALQEKILKEGRVMIVPGLDRWFGDGAKNHCRISFATSAEILNEAFDRIESVLSSY
ncbi:MAG: pyridoxal phosphate-dependent aminotransferase [Bacteroidota bacterium]